MAEINTKLPATASTMRSMFTDYLGDSVLADVIGLIMVIHSVSRKGRRVGFDAGCALG